MVKQKFMLDNKKFLFREKFSPSLLVSSFLFQPSPYLIASSQRCLHCCLFFHNTVGCFDLPSRTLSLLITLLPCCLCFFPFFALHISACIGFAIRLVVKTPYHDNVLYTFQGYFWIFIFPIFKEFINQGHVLWYHLDSTYPLLVSKVKGLK